MKVLEFKSVDEDEIFVLLGLKERDFSVGRGRFCGGVFSFGAVDSSDTLPETNIAHEHPHLSW